MRDILEKIFKKGFSISCTNENGLVAIRVTKENTIFASCALTVGSVRSSIEDALMSLLLDLERQGL